MTIRNRLLLFCEECGKFEVVEKSKKSKLQLAGALIVGVSISIGLLIGLSESVLFNLMYLALFAALVFGITLLIGIFDLFLKSRNFIYPGGVFILLITSVVFVFIISNIRNAIRQDRAKTLVTTIEDFKEHSGRYPQELSAIDEKPKGEWYYWADSAGTKFTLGYDLNGWNLYNYDSERGTWFSTD